MYARWVPEKGRREAWMETVERYVDFMRETLGKKLAEPEYKEIRDYMLNMQALGSMRLLWSAGKNKKAGFLIFACLLIWNRLNWVLVPRPFLLPLLTYWF